MAKYHSGNWLQGWVGRHIEDVTWRLSSVIKLGNLIEFNQKKRQRGVHLWWRLSHLALGVDYTLYHPWRGLATLLILIEWQPRPDDGISKEYNSHVFFCIRSDLGSCRAINTDSINYAQNGFRITREKTSVRVSFCQGDKTCCLPANTFREQYSQRPRVRAGLLS